MNTFKTRALWVFLFLIGHVQTGGKQTGGNDICVVTGIAVRCRHDARCRQCTGKRLSRAPWSSSTRRGCRICVTVRLPVRPRGETMYWQANANTPLSVTPLLNVPYFSPYWERAELFRKYCFGREKSLSSVANLDLGEVCEKTW